MFLFQVEIHFFFFLKFISFWKLETEVQLGFLLPAFINVPPLGHNRRQIRIDWHLLFDLVFIICLFFGVQSTMLAVLVICDRYLVSITWIFDGIWGPIELIRNCAASLTKPGQIPHNHRLQFAILACQFRQYFQLELPSAFVSIMPSMIDSHIINLTPFENVGDGPISTRSWLPRGNQINDDYCMQMS